MYTNSINTNAKITINNSNDIKLKNKDICIQSPKKSTGNFSATKYLIQLNSAETSLAVRNIITDLSKEANQAKDCENAQILLIQIKKVIGKAESKITKLSEEKTIEDKLKKSEIEKNQKEKNKLNDKLEIKKSFRKKEEKDNICDSYKSNVQQENSNESVENIINPSVESICDVQSDSIMPTGSIDTIV